MNFDNFKQYIKTLNDDDLNACGLDMEGKARRASCPQRKLGYYMAIDEIYIETMKRKSPIDSTSANMSDTELLEALNS